MWSHSGKCNKSGHFRSGNPRSIVPATCDPVTRVGARRPTPPSSPCQRPAGAGAAVPPPLAHLQPGSKPRREKEGSAHPLQLRELPFPATGERGIQVWGMHCSCVSRQSSKRGPPEKAPEEKLSPEPQETRPHPFPLQEAAPRLSNSAPRTVWNRAANWLQRRVARAQGARCPRLGEEERTPQCKARVPVSMPALLPGTLRRRFPGQAVRGAGPPS